VQDVASGKLLSFQLTLPKYCQLRRKETFCTFTFRRSGLLAVQQGMEIELAFARWIEEV